MKVAILKKFGAKIGSRVLIKPNINIKYPWFLEIGSDVWIGERVWIDNLTKVTIGSNVCISQDTYLLTGSHNYKKDSFDLMLGEIVLEDGVWIGAKSVVCPNVVCEKNSILTVGSIATTNLNKNSVYQGNPAILKRQR
jgi:putative colanic acid biosynthesis acetyltransferase WcaF